MRRYIDEGRCDQNALKLLSAYFRGAVFDRYHALAVKGEDEMFYIFNTSMDTTELTQDSGHKVFELNVHGGGGHGGWGSHARMLIYEELVKQEVLNRKEQILFEKIVVQSLSPKFLNFNRLERGANNRPYKKRVGLPPPFVFSLRCRELRNWHFGLIGNGENSQNTVTFLRLIIFPMAVFICLAYSTLLLKQEKSKSRTIVNWSIP